VESSPATAPSTTMRVIDVLLAFTEGETWHRLTDLAAVTGLTKPVVHRILQTMMARELVVADGASHRYRLGPTAYRLGSSMARQSELRAAALPIMTRLADATQETINISARLGLRRVYVDQVESFQPIRITIQVGQQVPLSIGSSGHAILAFLTAAEIDDVLAEPIPALTPSTVTDPDETRRRLAEVRTRGWSRSAAERVAGSSSVAAPIFDPDGEILGAVSVAALATRVDDARARELGAAVVRASSEITARLGLGRPDPGASR
jgi:IclR family acetate operon transcriptional repressor